MIPLGWFVGQLVAHVKVAWYDALLVYQWYQFRVSSGSLTLGEGSQEIVDSGSEEATTEEGDQLVTPLRD